MQTLPNSPWPYASGSLEHQRPVTRGGHAEDRDGETDEHPAPARRDSPPARMRIWRSSSVGGRLASRKALIAFCDQGAWEDVDGTDRERQNPGGPADGVAQARRVEQQIGPEAVRDDPQQEDSGEDGRDRRCEQDHGELTVVDEVEHEALAIESQRHARRLDEQ